MIHPAEPGDAAAIRTVHEAAGFEPPAAGEAAYARAFSDLS